MSLATQTQLKMGSSTSGVTPRIGDGLRHIISSAARMGASDIHIEPREKYILVRYRIGNSLQLGTKLPNATFKGLLMTTKRLAGVAAREKKRPQEGDFETAIDEQSYAVHLSVVPVLGGEKMVLHLSPKSSTVSLENLGYWGDNLDKVQGALGQLRGVVIIGGSQPSVRLAATTAMVNLLSHPSLKLASLAGGLDGQITSLRVEAQKGITPARSLKMILGQDPNVVVINDFTDKKIAKAALLASANKLICVKFFAEDIANALQRLANMDLGSSLLNSIKLISAQSIMPKLCANCREAYRPPAQLIKQIKEIDETFSLAHLHSLEQQAQRSGLGTDLADLGSSTTDIEYLWRAKNGGCNRCNYTGFNGYITLNEVADTSTALMQKILRQATVRRVDIQLALDEAGMTPMHIDGIIKCLRGLVEIDGPLNVARAHGYISA